jgi:hypothetical protein
MRLNGSRYFTSNEIQKMTEVFQLTNTDITFSAMGFFKVNYRMLCGVSFIKLSKYKSVVDV